MCLKMSLVAEWFGGRPLKGMVMNGWSNSSTYQMACIIDNREPLYKSVMLALREQGEDIAIFHRAEDDGEFQDFFVPKLAKTVETVVRDWYASWTDVEALEPAFYYVNWAEIAVAFANNILVWQNRLDSKELA